MQSRPGGKSSRGSVPIELRKMCHQFSNEYNITSVYDKEIQFIESEIRVPDEIARVDDITTGIAKTGFYLTSVGFDLQRGL